MVLEIMEGGELYNHIKINGKLPLERVRFQAAQVVLALQQLHENEVVYRDLKPENILIGRDGQIKLTDFGLSKNNIQDNCDTNTFCGTQQYLAPEIFTREGHGLAVDLWSLGCLIYEMLVGRPPFNEQNLLNLKDKVTKCQFDLPTDIDVEAKHIITDLLKVNPDQRLGAGAAFNKIKNHPFFAKIDFEKLTKYEVVPPWKPS